MTPHSSTLAWKIPWTEEPGRLQSMGSLRVGHDWMTSLSLFSFHLCWRRKWQPSPVFLPGESQGRGSLMGCSPWGPWRVRHDWSDLTTTTKWQEALGMSNVLSILLCLWKLIPNIQPVQWLIHVAKKEVWCCPVFHDPPKWLGSQTICRGLGCWWPKGFFWS